MDARKISAEKVFFWSRLKILSISVRSKQECQIMTQKEFTITTVPPIFFTNANNCMRRRKISTPGGVWHVYKIG